LNEGRPAPSNPQSIIATGCAGGYAERLLTPHTDPAAGPSGPAEDPSIPPTTIPTYENKGWYCIFAAGPFISIIGFYKVPIEKTQKNVLMVLKQVAKFS
jgi:hypothetical protein